MTPSKILGFTAAMLTIASTAVLADNSMDMHYRNTGAFSQFSSSYQQPNALTSTDIRRVQEALANRGFYNGPVDGVWGTRSRTALKEFQRSQGNEPTGLVSGTTLDNLGVTVDDRARDVLDQADETVRQNMRSNEH
jgi:peptidoglycan hydrolase-like protein with peptidoglycan-binding domain